MKVAGSSSEYFLENFCGKEDVVTPITPIESQLHTPRNFENGLEYRHTPPQLLFQKLSFNQFQDYRMVCGSRNTWDRIVSSYCMHAKHSRNTDSFKKWLINESSKTIRWHPKDKRSKSKLPHFLYQFSLLNNCCIITDWINQESLEKDLRTFCDSLGIDNKNINLLRAKHYNKKHYTEYYDDETREIVAEKYARDIEYFGYKFGG